MEQDKLDNLKQKLVQKKEELEKQLAQFADKDNEDGTTKVRYEYDMIGIPPDMDEEVSDTEGEEFEYLLGQIYIHVINEELEIQKQESEDGKNRKYHFNRPVLD